MATKIVMAIGDSGSPEPTPVDEVVEIGSVPLGPDNIVIPASVRAFRRNSLEKVPTKLLSIRKPKTRLNSRRFPLVTFECTPFERYRTKNGPVLGTRYSCFVRSESDATDQLFDPLTVRERYRILSSLKFVQLAAREGC